jgi:hypothetical protein
MLNGKTMQIEVLQRSPVDSLTHPDAEEYLATLQTLAHELDRAMSAIAAQELPIFEDSVTRQLATCVRLAEIPARATARRRNQSDSILPVDAELAARISAATGTLVTLNKRYAALLKHSGETMRLFAGLFRSYSDHPEQGSGTHSNLRTWSCEL